MAARFCPRCGQPLPSVPPTACTGCGYRLYVNARPTAGVIILSGDAVCGDAVSGDTASGDAGFVNIRSGDAGAGPRFLALMRAREPNAGRWDIPSGFCGGWEHPEAAAVREAREELGVEVALGDFVGMYLGGYEYQGETLPVLDCFWLASIVDGQVRVDPAEASGYAWLPLGDPPPMAFDTMDRALRDVRTRAVTGSPVRSR